MNRLVTANLIRDHEATRTRVYPDSEGVLTIAVGFNLEQATSRERIAGLGLDYDVLCAGGCEMTNDQVDALFEEDLDTAIADAASTLNNWPMLPDEVQAAMTDMSFNLGGPRFRKFENMIAALEADPPDYCRAAVEMRSSLWARQVGRRANDDIALVQQFCGA